MPSNPQPWTALTVLRTEAGWSRAELGRRITTTRNPAGVGGQHIGRLEAGLRGASREVMAALARALNTDADELAQTAPIPARQERYYRPRGIPA